MLNEYDTYAEAEDPASVPPETFTEELERVIGWLVSKAHIRLNLRVRDLQWENHLERQARGRIWRRGDNYDAIRYSYVGINTDTNRFVRVDEV